MIDTILKRRSVRTFTDQPISQEDIHTILKAGMAGPTAVNRRDWSFLVVTDPHKLDEIADAKGPTAEPLRRAVLGIVVCGDLERALPACPEFWTVDAAIACQNMLLAATELGIGSVWLGVWPVQEFVQKERTLLELPETIVPHSILAFGCAAEQEQFSGRPPRPEWESDRVHFGVW